MADWRKLYGEINASEKFHSVPERSRLGYLQAYLATDKRGFLPWSSKKLRALAFGLTDWTIEEVEEVREDLIRVGLWFRRADSCGQEFIEVWRFEETQGEPARRAREAPSKFGDPIDIKHIHGLVSATDKGGVPNGHGAHPEGTPRLDKIRGEERRGERERARTRISEDRAGESRSTIHPAAIQEAAMDRTQVIADFAAAIDSQSWQPSGIDDRARREHAGFVAQLPARRERFRAAAAAIRSDGKIHPHLFADVIQVLLVGLPSGNGAPARDPRDDPNWEDPTTMRLRREREERLAMPDPTPEEIAARRADIAALRSKIGRPTPTLTGEEIRE